MRKTTVLRGHTEKRKANFKDFQFFSYFPELKHKTFRYDTDGDTEPETEKAKIERRKKKYNLKLLESTVFQDSPDTFYVWHFNPQRPATMKEKIQGIFR